MTKLPRDVSYERVVRALKKKGFWIYKEGKHTSMTDGKNIAVIPRHSVIKPKTLSKILDGADLTVDEFKELL